MLLKVRIVAPAISYDEFSIRNYSKMERYEIRKPKSSKTRKRVGRGRSSGIGKTCGRGHNGQLSRSGSKRRPWFEGGQMPIQRRVPKRGFNNKFSRVYQLINIAQLTGCSETEIDPVIMKKSGLIKKIETPIKILGDGEITSAVTVFADAYSKSAKEKIEKAGGKAEIRKLEIKKKKKIEE